MNEHVPSISSDTPAPSDPPSLTRLEERLHVTTQTLPASIARLQKFIVTEQKTFTLDLRHEEVRLTTEPLADLQLEQPTDDQRDEIEMVL